MNVMKDVTETVEESVPPGVYIKYRNFVFIRKKKILSASSRQKSYEEYNSLNRNGMVIRKLVQEGRFFLSESNKEDSSEEDEDVTCFPPPGIVFRKVRVSQKTSVRPTENLQMQVVPSRITYKNPFGRIIILGNLTEDYMPVITFSSSDGNMDEGKVLSLECVEDGKYEIIFRTHNDLKTGYIGLNLQLVGPNTRLNTTLNQAFHYSEPSFQSFPEGFPRNVTFTRSRNNTSSQLFQNNVIKRETHEPLKLKRKKKKKKKKKRKKMFRCESDIDTSSTTTTSSSSSDYYSDDGVYKKYTVRENIIHSLGKNALREVKINETRKLRSMKEELEGKDISGSSEDVLGDDDEEENINEFGSINPFILSQLSEQQQQHYHEQQIREEEEMRSKRRQMEDEDEEDGEEEWIIGYGENERIPESSPNSMIQQQRSGDDDNNTGSGFNFPSILQEDGIGFLLEKSVEEMEREDDELNELIGGNNNDPPSPGLLDDLFCEGIDGF